MNSSCSLKLSSNAQIVTIDGILCFIAVIETDKNVRLKCTCFGLSKIYGGDLFEWTLCVKGALPILSNSEQQRHCYTSHIISVVASRSPQTGERLLLVLTDHEKNRQSEKKKSKLINIISSVNIQRDVNCDESKLRVTLRMNMYCHFIVEKRINCRNVVSLNDRYLCWLDEDINSFCCVETCDIKGEKTRVTKQECCMNNITLLASWSCNDMYIVVGLYSRKEINGKTSLFVNQFDIDKKQTLVVTELESNEINNVLPQDYAHVMQTLCIETLSLEFGKIKNSTVYAITTQKYLIKFVNGRLEAKINLLNMTDSVDCFIYGGRIEDMFVVSDDSCLRIYRCEQELKLLKEEEDVHCVLVDDFVGHGSPQLLLIKDEQPITCPPTDWTLTDLSGCYHGNKSTQEDTSSEMGDNLTSVLHALQKRSQRDRLLAEEKNREIREKIDLIESVCANLAAVTLRDQSSSTHTDSSGLVLLCGSSEETESDMTRPDSHPPVSVGELWVSEVDSATVIGVEVANLSERSMTNLSITPVPVDQTDCSITQSHSSWPIKGCAAFTDVSDDGSDWINNPVAKKPRLDPTKIPRIDVLSPKRKTNVLCCLESKRAIHAQDYDVLLFFDWMKPHGDESVQRDSGFPAVMSCGRVTVDIDRFTAGDKGLPASRQRLCRDFTYNQTDIDVTSASVELDLPQLLCMAGFEANPHKPGQYSAPRHASSLGHSRVQLYSSDKGRVTLRTRSPNELCALLRYLYHNLPDAVVINPASTSSENRFLRIQASTAALTKELDANVKRLRSSTDERVVVLNDSDEESEVGGHAASRVALNEQEDDNDAMDRDVSVRVCETRTDAAICALTSDR